MNTKSEGYLNELIIRYPELCSLKECIAQAADIIICSYRSGGQVLVCGNGGSASDSEHIVGEMMKGFVLKRELPEADVNKLKNTGIDDWKEIADCLQQAIPAIDLTQHCALSTAVLNDNDPYIGFAQQVYGYGRLGDVLIGLSTSGNSRNVVSALKVARAFGLKSIGFTGQKEALMDDLCDVIIKAPETETFKIQEFHLPIYHTLCLIVEEEIFGK